MNEIRIGILVCAACIGVHLPAFAGSTINAVNRHAYGANVGWMDARADGTHGAVIGLEAGASARVLNCTVTRGDGHGIVTGRHSIIQGCLTSENEGSGIHATDFSVVNDSTAATNAVHGIEVGMSSTVVNKQPESTTPDGTLVGGERSQRQG